MEIDKSDNIKLMPIPGAKRFFDIAVSFIFLVLTSPLFIIIFLAIFIEHILRGTIVAPLIYKETRISRGRPFNFMKFNVFKPRVIADLRAQNKFIHTKRLEHDGHSLLAVGRVIQKLYLDELPQLISILKGDMTIVGPRPVNTVNFQRHLKSGLVSKAVFLAGWTGPYQAHKGEPGVNQELYDARYIDYCRHNPAWKIIILDIKIIFRTLLIVFRAQGY